MRFKFDQIAINSTAKKKPVPEDAAHYIGLEHLIPGTFDIPEWGSEVAPVGEKLLMKKGDVLFGRRRAYQRKVGIAPFDGIFSAHGMVLLPRPEVVDEKYFPFFISSDQFMNEAVRISVGSLSPTINWRTLKNCEFDLPPLDEQKKLAELLWAANDLKESYKKAITATDEMLKAKFREMFGECGGQGAEGDRSVSKWPLVRISEVATDVRYGTSKPGDKDGAYAYLRMNNLTDDGGLDLTDLKRITLSGEDFNKCVVRRGDILFNRTNTKELVGKTAYYDLDDDMVIAGYIIRVRVDRDKIDPRYLWKLMNTVELKTKLRHMAKGAIHQANINAQELQSIEIPLPPLSLQREFVAIADKAESAKANLKKSIAAIETLIKGLLN